MTTPPRSPIPRAPGIVLGVAALLAVGVLVAGSLIGLCTSTETRYAEIGREMHASGDLVVPTLNGAPHLEKPPFAYWALAAAYAAAGVNDVAARLPGLLAAALTLLVIGGTVRRLAPPTDPDPRGLGRAGVLVAATLPAFVMLAYTVSTDPWLVLTTPAAGAAVLAAMRAEGRSALRASLALHAALGVGMLVKGPAVFVTPLVGAVLAALGSRSARPLRAFVDPRGLALFAAVAVPWYLLADGRLPGLLDLYVTRRLVGAVASSAEFHDNPAWIVWVPVVLGSAPWIGGILGGTRTLARRADLPRGTTAALVGMALAAPVFFTFSRSRLPTYGLQALPWIAILIAAGSPTPGAPGGDSDARRWRFHASVSSIGLGLAVIVACVRFLVWQGDAPPATWAALAGSCALVVLALARPRTGILAAPGRRAPLVTLAAALAVAAGAATVPFEIDAQRSLIDAMNRARGPGEEIGVALHKNGDWGVTPFYAGRTVRFFGYQPRLAVDDPAVTAPATFRPLDDLAGWLTAPERRWLFVRTKEVDDVARTREISSRFGTAALHVVARGPLYSVVTNRAPGVR